MNSIQVVVPRARYYLSYLTINSKFPSIEMKVKYQQNGVATSNTIDSNNVTFKLNNSFHFYLILAMFGFRMLVIISAI